MKKRYSSSSKRWLFRNSKDQFVQLARRNNLRSRAWFKLHDIHVKYNLFTRSMCVIDLGAAPGSWSKYSKNIIGNNGYIIACDINFMHSIPGVYFLQGNVADKKIFKKLLDKKNYKKINLVMSDMSPNITGISSIDIPKSIALSQLAMNIAIRTLHKGGTFLVKVFQGIGFEDFLKQLSVFFNIIKICKPNASRDCSREVFILARDFKK
ncbi:RlmE family RNA methyltransferase [Buchnera aphidicola]|uniref:Ribosomal RNA large subunit methyltransferase E n=1 Tax=Buchnera aphidicola (Sarucallis kahawaluokalani) TaxID=1241878 RepID=A0A4D6Y8Q7_9GAMM|nr:SAM-dependent methyltransferase [Buchnera aphidicola]QCI26047.1 23S rRNA (uridine(2552)-2'-O)-methyltransferase [Buchnera aphidicola (Sarucallis kahawaluokalani)]